MTPAVLISLVAVLSACSVGPPYTPPEIEIPTQWKNHTYCGTEEESETEFFDHWWEVFEDEKLNELENLA